MPDLKHMQASATRLIRRWGGPATLWRGTASRPCLAAIGSYTPKERQVVVEDAVRVLISAPIAVPPDYKLDEIEFPKGSGQRYRIVKPVGGERTDGKTIIKYDCECLDGDHV